MERKGGMGWCCRRKKMINKQGRGTSRGARIRRGRGEGKGEGQKRGDK